jgi:uncharacterized protein YndB with AHSA1/START domain
MTEIRHMLLVDAPVEIVYRAVTEQKGLAGWWTVQALAEPKVDTVADFKFGDRYRTAMRVAVLDPPRRVEWECVAGDEEWVGTRVVFGLEPKGDQTLVRFLHGGWRQATDFFASCNYNWGYYLTSLKSYCETGHGTPFEYKA